MKCFWETRKGSLDDIFQEPLLMAEIAGQYVPAPSDYGFVDRAKQERGYFVTEYCEDAVDGEEWLKAHGNLGIDSGIAVGLQVAKALQLAHNKGIFHLDLKPANLLLSPTKNFPSVKVIDFGLAKVAKSLQEEMSLKQSKSGLSVLAQSVFGTFDYAPPEQQGYGGEPSAKSDVYAFGKTLYPRRLAKAPKLFELLCDCVEREVDKRADLASVISRLSFWHTENIKAYKAWWNQLDDEWKGIFKKAIKIDAEPSESELEKIVYLQKLELGATYDKKGEISSLEPVRQLTNLQELNCDSNKIGDLEPLRQLTSLKKLFCGDNQISDLEPLHQLTSLQVLHCYLNKISDLEPLRQLTNLQVLRCFSNEISDLEPLRHLTNLQELACRSNKISDLEPLRHLTSLRELWCRSNKISDLKLLRQLTSLQVLDCSKNPISDLESLRQLTNLQVLNCTWNKISDLEPLRQLTSLQELDYDSDKISNVEPLRQLTIWQNSEKLDQIESLEKENKNGIALYRGKSAGRGDFFAYIIASQSQIQMMSRDFKEQKSRNISEYGEVIYSADRIDPNDNDLRVVEKIISERKIERARAKFEITD